MTHYYMINKVKKNKIGLIYFVQIYIVPHKKLKIRI